jgi:hypothetical protein
MFRSTFVLVAALVCWSGSANAQYEDDSPSEPWFGGPGDYVYPVICARCSVWQDYRNFSWNQLSINGGDARTPTNPNHVTTFRVYTHATNDIYPATVEVTLEIEEVKLMGETIGQRPVDGKHYFVETHPENGDNVPVGYYPKEMGPLQFPYVTPQDNNSGSGGGTSSNRSGRGGDSPRGGGYGGTVGGVFGRGFGRIFGGRGELFCGLGTDYICIQY